MKKLPIALLVFTAALPASQAARAFNLTPISASVEPAGPGANQSFIISNDTEESLAAEVYILPRLPDLDGQETYEKKSGAGMEKLFLIYPPQTVLKAHEKRTVRVSWIGDPRPPHELAFRLIAEQLPVKTDRKAEKQGAQIKVLLKYAGAVYVTPKNSKPQLLVKEALPSMDKKKPGILLTLENRGTAHQILIHFVMKIASPSLPTALEIDSEKLPELSGQNVLAGSLHRFSVPLPISMPLKSPVQVSFEFKE
jgi:fimbrial chaperone protein